MIYPGHRSQFFKRSILQNKFLYFVLGAALLVVALYFGIGLIGSALGGGKGQVSMDTIREHWTKTDYKKVIEESTVVLNGDPMNFDALLYRGFSYFFQGISQPDFEDKAQMLAASTVDLRRCLVLEPYRQNRDIYFILGKVYYQRGYFFQDLAKEYLLKAWQNGYKSNDLNEYLGRVCFDLGDTKAAIDYFKQAINDDPRDIVLLSLAQAYIAVDDYKTAMDYVNIIIGKSKDAVTIQKARFVRGELLTHQGKGDEAIAEYESILKENPNSADAHFYLGEVYSSKGDTVKARAQWREAYNIDPKHVGAISRLNS